MDIYSSAVSNKRKGYAVTEETLNSFSSYWEASPGNLNWNCLFMVPPWIQSWWRHFCGTGQLRIYAVRQSDDVIGFAPLLIKGKTAYFAGSADVCDYGDFIVAPGREPEFFKLLIDHLKQQGVCFLMLTPLRPDSAVLAQCIKIEQSRACKVSCFPEAVSFEMPLPGTWDEYLCQLNGKQRHELRRKLRRLEEAGSIQYRIVEDRDELRKEFKTFLGLFKANRKDKKAFMTDTMAAFFFSLIEVLGDNGIAKLAFLEIDCEPAAVIMYFDYNSTTYLYNSGYDQRFSAFNAGLLSKAFNIKESIERHCEKYDFLKGAEIYKHRLGGKPIQLYRCLVEIR